MKIKKNVLLIITVLLLLIVIRLIKPSSIEYEIFKESEEKYYFHKIIGITPKLYSKDKFKEIIIERKEGVKLIKLLDLNSPNQYSFFILEYNRKNFFLKAIPYSLLRSNKGKMDNINYENFVSYEIDIQVFNEYVKLFEFNKKDTILNKYFYFIDGGISFKRVKDKQDLIDIYNQHNVLHYDIVVGSKYVDISEIEIEQGEEIHYCWFSHIGLVKFKINFEDNSNVIKSIDSKLIGTIGNYKLEDRMD
jgi:hypothetical protein